MPRFEEQKLKILFLYKILLEETDERHPLTIKELQDKLEVYGIPSERKSLYSDIENLRSFGVDVEVLKSKAFSYYVASRDFQLPELKLLVDAVQCSKFITPRKTNELIHKLEGLTSKHEARGLQRQVYVSGRVKTMNESIYYNTDIIHTAILSSKKISFKYFEWVIDFGQSKAVQKVFKRKGKSYVVSPWALTWNDENYYLVAYDDKEKLRKHFRVDKMSGIEVLEEERAGDDIFYEFDMGEYCKKHFDMFGGNEAEVKIIFENDLIGVVVDRFGSDLFIVREDERHFKAVIKVEVSPTFMGWILSFGSRAKIISPDYVVGKIKEYITETQEIYK